MLKVFGYDIGYWIVYYVDLMILLLIEVYEYIVGLVWDCDGVIIWVVFIDYWLVMLMIGFWIEFDGVLVVFVGDIVFCDSFDQLVVGVDVLVYMVICKDIVMQILQ